MKSKGKTLSVHLLTYHIQRVLFEHPATSEAHRYSEAAFSGVLLLKFNDVDLDERFYRILEIIVLVLDAITAVNLFNFGEQEPTPFFLAAFCNRSQYHALFRLDLIPEPVEVVATRLHNFVMYKVHIIDRHIVFALCIAVIDDGPAHQVDQVGLIRRQSVNFLDGERLIFEVACHRFLDQILRALCCEPRETVVDRDVEED